MNPFCLFHDVFLVRTQFKKSLCIHVGPFWGGKVLQFILQTGRQNGPRRIHSATLDDVKQGERSKEPWCDLVQSPECD